MSADYHPTPTEGVIMSQTIFRYLEVIFEAIEHLARVRVRVRAGVGVGVPVRVRVKARVRTK